jgi:hypothetical protein
MHTKLIYTFVPCKYRIKQIFWSFSDSEKITTEINEVIISLWGKYSESVHVQFHRL